MMLKRSKRWVVSFLLLTCIFSQLTVIVFAWEIDETASVTSVIDGDSFYITGDEVRLADVSAPEWNESGGSTATSALKALINGKTVYLDTDQKSGRDRYGRLIAVVYIKTSSTQYTNVNKALLNQGVVSRTDYTNNEFNPSTWTLYVYTSSQEQDSRLRIALSISIGILAIIYFSRLKKGKKREYRP
ncbi:micrococcal nuclease-like nuclease [Thaumarchaeota archaeon SCGC AB-539-E09]|nr:micrococcal nuclease-like nuclease [Thaumarchaeota archaeon SCGC AB-539-E09]